MPSHTCDTKILADPVSLGRSAIQAATLLMDGQALPAWLTLNAAAGTVQRVTPITTDRTLYHFTFDYDLPAPDYTPTQQADAQAISATYLTSFPTLNARSILYCVINLRLAEKYGETPTITTRAEATAWLNANTDFQSFSSGQRQFLRRLIDAIAEGVTVPARW